MADWKPFVIQIPGKDILEPVRNVLETLLVFLDVLKAILDTIKIFLIDFGDPIKALVEALIKLIEELFLSLKATGVSAYFDVPDPTQDPNFNRISGGFPAFTTRFKASLFDSKDFNRPQPRPGSTQGGFVLLVVDASNPFALILRVKQLLRFFGKEFTTPRFEPPGNLRALPVGSKGDPILAVASIFTNGPIKSIELQWALPTTLETPDPGFSDVVTKVAREFVPPQFLIERSTINPASQKIDISQLADPASTGLVEFDRETWTDVTEMATPVLVRETLRDEYKDAVIKFQKYIVIGELAVTSILGQLGKFRWLDTDVEPNTTYYYRVRAFAGDLKMSGDQVAFPSSVDQLTFSTEAIPGAGVMAWPPVTANSSIVMGKASGVVSASVPIVLADNFNVIENLQRLLQTAFSLDFHLQIDPAATFNDAGDPTGPTSPVQVGRGTLTDLASAIAIFESFVTVGNLSRAKTINEGFQPDPITGEFPELPWTDTAVIKQGARLGNIIASALLEAGGEALNGFRNYMQQPLPAGSIDVGGNLAGLTTLEQVVKAFTPIDPNSKAAQTFVTGYSNVSLRKNVLAAISFIKNYTLGGAPVDWISVVPLRDIVPWSGQMIYDMLDKIQALLDAFKGVMDEIRQFIDLLERKIEALERFIKFLIDILNFITSLQIGAYILSVPELSGSAQSWVSAIDTAGGTKPPSGPGGYSAGIGLAYVASDITAFKTAFSVIFGG